MPPARVLAFAAITASLPACAPSRATQALEPKGRPTAQPSRDPEPSTLPSPAAEDGRDAFAVSVRPMLLARCTPCHIPGGKMYERLPFDDSQVVKSHKDGILRRLKGEDLETFRGWIAQSK